MGTRKKSTKRKVTSKKKALGKKKTKAVKKKTSSKAAVRKNVKAKVKNCHQKRKYDKSKC